jgi:leucyl/phenylalanyl-tRNA---protein transferase
MGESRQSDELYWFNPDPRAIIPLNAWHISHSLRKTLRTHPYRISVNTCFADVMRHCAEPRKDEGDSWINADIIDVYTSLHELGYAHSIECWDGSHLIGGLYGVSRGGAFFGESMFSRAPNTSKIAYAYLLEILLDAGYALLDTQFVNPHLLQFGVIEIPKKDYLYRLRKALTVSPNPSHAFTTSSGKVLATPIREFIVTSSSPSST